MEITEKLFQSIIDYIGRKTSIGFAVSLLSKVIEVNKEKYEVLNLIDFNKTQYNRGMESIRIDNQINYYKTFELGKALRSIILETGENLDSIHKMEYIEGAVSKQIHARRMIKRNPSKQDTTPGLET